MEAGQLIQALLLGALLGASGQVLRVIVGLKKLNDTAQQQNTSFKSVFETSQFVISLIIGAVAGILAVVAMLPLGKDFDFSQKQVVLGFMAAGYAGTDFIEGFVKKFLPSSTDASTNISSNTAGAVAQPSPKKQ